MNKMCLQILCLIYMYEEDLALNNLQWLICHKTKPNHIYSIYMYEEDLALNNLQRLICHKTKSNHIYLMYTYLPTPPLEQDMTQGQSLSGV